MRSDVLRLLCAFATGVAAEVVSPVCFVGYLMDVYCIDRGTLLDNNALTSLEHPAEHTIHCLVDPPQCASSDYEVLEDPAAGATHCRAYRLDAAGKGMALALARASGQRSAGCTTCTGEGTATKGFRATFFGEVAGTGSPPTLVTSRVAPADVGCNGSATVPSSTNCASDRLRPFIRAHGSLMLTSWGLCLPAGAGLAALGRHRDPAWFKLHRSLCAAPRLEPSRTTAPRPPLGPHTLSLSRPPTHLSLYTPPHTAYSAYKPRPNLVRAGPAPTQKG